MPPKSYFGDHCKPSPQYSKKDIHDHFLRLLTNITDIDELAIKFMHLVDSEKTPRGKQLYFEFVAGYHVWELLQDKSVAIAFNRNTIKDDKFDPFCFVNWPNYFKNPISYFSRTVDDALKTIHLICVAGYSPFSKNTYGENAFESLRYSVMKNNINPVWEKSMIVAYTHPTEESARRIIKKIMTKITPGTADLIHDKVVSVNKNNVDGSISSISNVIYTINFRTI